MPSHCLSSEPGDEDILNVQEGEEEQLGVDATFVENRAGLNDIMSISCFFWLKNWSPAAPAVMRYPAPLNLAGKESPSKRYSGQPHLSGYARLLSTVLSFPKVPAKSLMGRKSSPLPRRNSFEPLGVIHNESCPIFLYLFNFYPFLGHASFPNRLASQSGLADSHKSHRLSLWSTGAWKKRHICLWLGVVTLS